MSLVPGSNSRSTLAPLTGTSALVSLALLLLSLLEPTRAQVKFQTSIVPGPSHIGIPSACFLRVDPGPCGRDIVRVYYDHKTYTCKAFSYSGNPISLLASCT